MSETLKSRTTRSALFLLKENLRDLRTYAENFDPDEIDRLVKAADLVSSSLKKLLAWVSDAPTNEVESASAGDMIDVVALSSFLSAANTGRLCPRCDGLMPSATE